MGIASFLFSAGCTDEDAVSPQPDAAEALDSAADAGTIDVGVKVIDAAMPDAATPDAAMPDAPALDATAAADALACAPSPTKVQCKPEPNPNEITGGLFISAGAPVGWKFEVKGDCPRTLTRLGLNVRNGANSDASIFGAIVALPANDPRPLDPTLFPAAILKTVLLHLGPHSSGSKTVSAEVSVNLVPGWYEVVFGVGAFGATATSFTVDGDNPMNCTDNSFPFTFKTEEKKTILQGIGPHIFVEMK